MNFFTDGIGNATSEYPDFLDALIGTIPDELLEQVVTANPVISPDKLTLKFQFNELPGEYTASVNRENWDQRQDEIQQHIEAITMLAKISAGKFDLADLAKIADIPYTVTPEVIERINSLSMNRHMNWNRQLPRNNARLLFDGNDFTTW